MKLEIWNSYHYSTQVATPSNQHCSVIRSHRFVQLALQDRLRDWVHILPQTALCLTLFIQHSFLVLPVALQCSLLFTARCNCAVYPVQCSAAKSSYCPRCRFRKWLHFKTMRHFARWCLAARKPNDIATHHDDLDDIYITVVGPKTSRQYLLQLNTKQKKKKTKQKK